jgi:hypothetical protein
MAEESAVNYWQVSAAVNIYPHCDPNHFLAEILSRRLRARPKGRVDVLRAAIQTSSHAPQETFVLLGSIHTHLAAEIRRGQSGSRVRRTVRELLLLLHHPEGYERDPEYDRRKFYSLLMRLM